MEAKAYGYIRVSTREQNEERQRIAMRDFGVPEERIYLDKLSGKSLDRPAWQKLIRRLKPGDILVVKSVDRIGRSYADVIETWRVLTKGKGVAIVVLDMPLLDTRSVRDSMGIFIADLVLQILSYFAQIEREFNHQRQAEGIAAAKARGVKFGRPRKKPSAAFHALRTQWETGAISANGAARMLGVAPNTFHQWVKE